MTRTLAARAVVLMTAVLALTACGQDGDGGTGPRSPAPSSPAAAQEDDGEQPVTVRATLLADRLTAPIDLVSPPDRPDRVLVLDQAGTVRDLAPGGGLLDVPPFLDLTDAVVPLATDRDDERGLLGLAFSPTYATDRLVYVFRTAPAPDRPELSHRNVLSAFRTDPAGDRVDRSTERVLWTHDQRYRSHAAGQLVFDAQGRLLVLLGDAQELTAQDPASPMGKVLRFDVARPESPPEVLASGMRHPWRVSSDEPTGQLLFAEPNFTSQAQEVNALVPGANYGWQLERPASCYGFDDDTPVPACTRAPDGTPLTPPVAEYGPERGLIVAGAQVYRGTGVPALADRLVVADWGVNNLGTARGGRLHVSDPIGSPPYRLRAEVEVTGLPSDLLWFWSLDRDAGGELVLMTLRDKAPEPGGGAVWRLGPA